MEYHDILLFEGRHRKIASYKLAVAAGLDPTTYSRIENGKQQPTKEQMDAIAAALRKLPDRSITSPERPSQDVAE